MRRSLKDNSDLNKVIHSADGVLRWSVACGSCVEASREIILYLCLLKKERHDP